MTEFDGGRCKLIIPMYPKEREAAAAAYGGKGRKQHRYPDSSAIIVMYVVWVLGMS